MKVPKYVQELMSRSEFDLLHPRGDPGYTLKIYKATPYSKADTLKAEVERAVAWANRIAPVPPEWDSDTARILSVPHATHYCDQYAVATFYDPVMKELEKYIPEDGRIKAK